MNRRLTLPAAACWILASLPAMAAPAAAAQPPVSFTRDVLPILTRAGCNQGSCHGSPTGKGGFRLSLRGYDPALDRFTLLREAGGRRIDPLEPDASLVLRKAVGAVPHEGGRRFGPDQREYALLRAWIGQGAHVDVGTGAGLVTLTVSPAERALEEPARSEHLAVTAHFADGSERDVTHLCRFSVNATEVAAVSPDGVVEQRGTGEVVVSAEYMNHMATARLAFLPPAPGFRWPDVPEANYVDRLAFAKLRRMRIEPSALCTDAEFIRRATLDVTGRLPTPQEIRAFLADPSPGKRDRLIDALLERDAFADWWALKWADRLGCNQRFVGKIGAHKYHEWVRQQMAANVPEDVFVRTVLTASGGNYSRPAAGFYRRVRDPQTRAEEVAQLFLGVRMQCARCHNHPGERWTQDDYHGFAAFFARVRYRNGPFFVGIYDKEETVFDAHDGELPHPRTGQPVRPKYLGGPTADLASDADRRQALAAWVTDPRNPFFARAAVNRLWYHLFGRGIVEPVDDFRITNPPSNPELLDALAEDFVRGGFDRKRLIRTVLHSRTYQLAWRPTATNATDEQYFSHARVRLLPAEALLDAIGSATGVGEKFAGFPAGTTAAALPDGEFRHPFLEAFGRPARAMACECERGTDTTITQALHLTGAGVFEAKVRSPNGRVARLIASNRPDGDVVDELFLATLCREPTRDEKELLTAKLRTAGSRRQRVAEDILWALVNHPEFMFQH